METTNKIMMGGKDPGDVAFAKAIDHAGEMIGKYKDDEDEPGAPIPDLRLKAELGVMSALAEYSASWLDAIAADLDGAAVEDGALLQGVYLLEQDGARWALDVEGRFWFYDTRGRRQQCDDLNDVLRRFDWETAPLVPVLMRLVRLLDDGSKRADVRDVLANALSKLETARG